MNLSSVFTWSVHGNLSYRSSVGSHGQEYGGKKGGLSSSSMAPIVMDEVIINRVHLLVYATSNVYFGFRLTQFVARER